MYPLQKSPSAQLEGGDPRAVEYQINEGEYHEVKSAILKFRTLNKKLILEK